MQNGYYFVLVEYENGRVVLGRNKFRTLCAAERDKERRIKKVVGNDVKRVTVHYQCGMNDVDVKRYV